MTSNLHDKFYAKYGMFYNTSKNKAIFSKAKYNEIINYINGNGTTNANKNTQKNWRRRYKVISKDSNLQLYKDGKRLIKYEELFDILLCAHNETRQGSVEKMQRICGQKYYRIPRSAYACFLRIYWDECNSNSNTTERNIDRTMPPQLAFSQDYDSIPILECQVPMKELSNDFMIDMPEL